MVTHLIPWNRGSAHLFDLFRREMDDFAGHLSDTNGEESSSWFSPRTNVVETENQYEITLDLPGLSTEDFELEFLDGQLTVRGTRKQEKEDKGKTYHRIERSYGEFRRSFTLGRDVDADKVEAEYKDGVLRVTVPKAEAVLPKRIAIKS